MESVKISTPVEVHSNETSVESKNTYIDGTTSFPTDAFTASGSTGKLAHAPSYIPIRDQAISDFLSKPVMLNQTEWTTSMIANTQITDHLTGSALATTGPEVWAEKIKGFGLIRGTAVYRVLINPTPFQQGRLLLAFVPGSSANETAPTRLLCRGTATQLPSVQLDCRDGAAELRVPYISPTDWMSTFDALFGHGLFSLRVMSPLATGASGETTVSVTTFLHFEDIELAAPMFPQSGLASSGKSARKIKNRPSGKAISKDEASKMVSQPISQSLSLVSKAADTLSGIPVISQFAGPVAWFTRAASQAASAFGWSKPELDAAHSIVTKRVVPFMPNATGASSAISMSMLHDSAIHLMDDFAGTEHDEMSFSYIKSRESYITSFSMTIDNAPNTTLFSFAVAPSACQETFSIVHTTTNTYAAYAPFAFLSRYFTFWRGTVRLKFVFIKTDFHSGRLLITFTPNVTNSPVYPNISESSYSLREIVDIRGRSEITLDLPFLQEAKWIGQSSASGYLRVSVLNELKAPETCATGINVLVFASAGEDFEYAAVDRSSDLDNNAVFFPQMDESALPLVSEVIGGYTKPNQSMEPTTLTIGEQFTSVRLLLSRYCPLLGNALITNGAGNISSIYPWQMQLCGTKTTDNTVIYPTYGFDPLSEISSGYALFRGSIKMLLHNVNGTQPISAVVTSQDVNSGTFSTVNTTANTVFGAFQLYSTRNWNDVISYGPVAVSDSYNGMHEFKIPYYCKTHSSWVANRATRLGSNTYSSTPAATWLDKPVTMLQYVSEGTANAQTHFYRSIGEDFQLGYFVGFAPVRLT